MSLDAMCLFFVWPTNTQTNSRLDQSTSRKHLKIPQSNCPPAMGQANSK